MNAGRSALYSWAGSIAGPAAWALSTQASYSWATLSCDAGARSSTFLTIALALLSLAGAFFSWRALRAIDISPAQPPRTPRTKRFVAGMGIGMGILFSIGILFQFLATVVFTGCES